jgi:glycosyltransferase involved in cell wall biosynthesis
MTILHIVLNSFTNDSRVLREIDALSVLKLKQKVFSTHKHNLPTTEMLPHYNLLRFKLFTQKLHPHFIVTILRLIECVIRMTLSGIRLKPTVIHAHDLNGLTVGWLITRFTKSKLVYDSHEYWADCAHKAKFPAWLYDAIVPKIEGFMARDTVAVITVSDGIADRMRDELRLRARPIVLRNMPFACALPHEGKLRMQLNLTPDTIILLYIGAIAGSRGLYDLLEAFSRLADKNIALVFIGNGAETKNLDQRIQDKKLQNRAFRLPAVPPETLMSYIKDATIGISPIQPTNQSYALCLPNKLFEYIQGGLAVLASDLPEMAAIINEYQIGRTFKSDDVNDLTKQIQMLVDNPEQLRTYQTNALKAAKILNWDHEKSRLIDLYNSKIINR